MKIKVKSHRKLHCFLPIASRPWVNRAQAYSRGLYPRCSLRAPSLDSSAAARLEVFVMCAISTGIPAAKSTPLLHLISTPPPPLQPSISLDSCRLISFAVLVAGLSMARYFVYFICFFLVCSRVLNHLGVYYCVSFFTFSCVATTGNLRCILYV